MNKIKRFGVSIETELLSKFDEIILKKGYLNRSEAIRDLIREDLIKIEHENKNSQAMGTISLVYDHHIHHLTEKLTEIQHEYSKLITSAIHIHLDHHNCLEVIVVKGLVKDLSSLANKLASVKGVKTGKLTLAI